MNSFRCLALILFLLASKDSISQAKFYISPNGDDNQTGTSLEEPFRSLSRAVKAVAGQRHNTPHQYQIIMRGGIYPVNETIVMDSSTNLHPESSLTVAAYGAEKPVLSGNKPLTNRWEKVGPNLWKTDVDDYFNQLFVDGKRAVRSRYPNEGLWLEPDTIQLSDNRLVFNDKIPEEFKNIKGAELHTTGYWHYIRQKISLMDPEHHAIFTEIYPGPEASSRKISTMDRAHFESALLFVDSEEEWFLDSMRKELFVYSGKDPNSRSFEYPVIATLLKIEGTKKNSLHHIRIDGISFRGTEWEMSAIGRKGIQAGFWGSGADLPVYAPVASLMLDWVNDSRISNCNFELLGEGAITLGLGCTHNEIIGNGFTDIGANVIQVGYREHYTGDGHPLHLDFTDQEEVSHHNIIRNNHLKNFATTDKGSVGIWIGYSHNNHINHNLLEDFPYSGISVGWYWGDETDTTITNCHSNIIEWNEIRNGMKYLSDGAGIYLVGNQPDTRISDNWIHNIGGGYTINSGIYIDEGGANMEITRNFFLNLTNPREAYPIKLHKNNIPSMNIYNNGGQTIRHEILNSNPNYAPAKHVNVRLTAPADRKRYGIK